MLFRCSLLSYWIIVDSICEDLFNVGDADDIVTKLELLLYSKYTITSLLGTPVIFSLKSITVGMLHYAKSFWAPRMVWHPETTSQMIQSLFQAHLFLLIRNLSTNTMEAAPAPTTTTCNVLELLNVSPYFFPL